MSKDKIYTDEQIYAYYIGEMPYKGKLYKSPLRDDGNKPSFSFSYAGSTMYWTDFGKVSLINGIKRNGIGLVRQIEGISEAEAEIFIKEKILPSLANSTFYDKQSSGNNSSYKDILNERGEVKETIQIRKFWKDFEYNYWEGLDWGIIKDRGIHPLHKYQKEGRKSYVISTEISPAFVYVLDMEKRAYKIYRPLDLMPINKWRSRRIGTIIEGYSNLPKTKIESLIITSSTKDGVTVMSSIDDCWSINPHSENVWTNILKKARDINARARNVYVWLDSDRAGIENTMYICGLTGWKPILLGMEMKDKDMKDQFDIFKVGGRGLVNHFFSKFKNVVQNNKKHLNTGLLTWP